MVAVYQVELAVAAFDPVVADDGACGSVFEVVSPAAFSERTEAVKLENDTVGFGVVVVFVESVFDAVVIDITPFDQDVAGPAGAKEAVAGVPQDAVANGDVFAFFQENGGTVFGVFSLAFATGESEGRTAAADVKVFDDHVFRHRVGRDVCASYFDDAAFFVPKIEYFAGGGVSAIDDGETAIGIRDTTDNNGVGGGALTTDDPFFAVGFASGVDGDCVSGTEGFPGHVSDLLQWFLGADFVVFGRQGTDPKIGDQECDGDCAFFESGGHIYISRF